VQSLLFWHRAQKLMAADLKSAVRRQYPLAEAQKAVKDYQSQMTGGKILLIPARDGV
jgi:NADPH:quinone reductase